MGGGGFTAFHASTAAHIIDGGNIVNVCPKCRMVTERSCGFSATAMATESRAVFTSDGESWNCVLSPNQEGYRNPANKGRWKHRLLTASHISGEMRGSIPVSVVSQIKDMTSAAPSVCSSQEAEIRGLVTASVRTPERKERIPAYSMSCSSLLPSDSSIMRYAIQRSSMVT